jgi:hypothetical protein
MSDLAGRRFTRKPWAPPVDNPAWDHDHCEVCWVELSQSYPNTEREGYVDDENRWVCATCFVEHKNSSGWI